MNFEDLATGDIFPFEKLLQRHQIWDMISFSSDKGLALTLSLRG